MIGAAVGTALTAKSRLTETPNMDMVQERDVAHHCVMITPNQPKESGIYRNIHVKDWPLDVMYSHFYGGPYKTVLRWMKEACLKYNSRPAVGVRPIVRVETTMIQESRTPSMVSTAMRWRRIMRRGREGQEQHSSSRTRHISLTHFGPTRYYSYAELWRMITAFGIGLAQLTELPLKSRVGIYEDTRLEWLVSCYGLWSQGYVGVTVYANLGEDALGYAAQESDMSAIVLNGKFIEMYLRATQEGKGNTSSRKKHPILIYTDSLPPQLHLPPGIALYSWQAVVAHGEKVLKGNTDYLPQRDMSQPPPPPPPTNQELEQRYPQRADDLALIMYTSGTTGDPKGVMLTHGNIYACVKGFDYVMAAYTKDVQNVSYVAYLPLAHILEFAVENVMFMNGSLVGYGNPRTLTNHAARPHGDLQEFRPVFIVGVPRVYDTIKKAVESQLPEVGFRRQLFERAYAERLRSYDKALHSPSWDATVFAKPRAILGGRCRALVSGGAPLSAQTQQFMEVVFGLSVSQGYGLTETGGNCAVQGYWAQQKNSIGPLVRSCEVKLVDYDDWKHTDVPEPRGELWIRGPVVCKGYYRQPKKTREALTSDGWLRTGDIAKVAADGSLAIVGRVKSLAKNALGEYIAMESLEVVYVLNELCLPNGICVLVHPHRPYIAALVLTDEGRATRFAKSHGIDTKWPALLDNPLFHRKAAASLAATAAAHGRPSFEHVRFVRVLGDEWTAENGMLTAASKLKRSAIEKKYNKYITELFSQDSRETPAEQSKL